MIRNAILLLALVAAELPAQKAPRYTKIPRLTPREGVFAYARISPDGKRLVYASNITRGNSPTQWTETIVDLASSKTLWTGGGIDAYWSPDGTRVIYSSDEGTAVRNVETGEV